MPLMKITYLVAGSGERPNGGTRIIYEHANRLATRGHRVRLHHILDFPSDRLRGRPRRLLAFLKRALRSHPAPDWFRFGSGVETSYAFRAKLPDFEADERVVATYWKTHDVLPNWLLEERDCFYLIQGFETNVVAAQVLYSHWRSPSKNLVISHWLEDKVRSVSGQATLVPNAIDFDFFTDDGSRRRNEKPTILFASMADPWKGAATTIDTLNRLRSRDLEFHVVSFGNFDPTGRLKGSCEHHHMPSQEKLRALYRRADIYANASRREGWGLTLAEAAACGAALVVSNNLGHREVVEPDCSALFFEPDDIETMANALADLLENPARRAQLAAAASDRVRRFNWDSSIDRLESALAAQ